MNTLCASPLNLCCNFNIISLFLHFLKSSNLVACLIRYFFPFLFVKIAIICLITIHLLYQRNKLFQCSSITDFIVECIKYCLNIFCKFVLNILRFDMYYDAFCVCTTQFCTVSISWFCIITPILKHLYTAYAKKWKICIHHLVHCYFFY